MTIPMAPGQTPRQWQLKAAEAIRRGWREGLDEMAVQAGDLIARHLVAFHNACDWLDQSERAALLAKDVVSLHRAELSPAALHAIDAISMEDILDGGPTGEWGIRMTATARINALVKTEDRDTQRWRLRGVIAGLIVLWPSGPHRTDLQTILDLINPADGSKQ